MDDVSDNITGGEKVGVQTPAAPVHRSAESLNCTIDGPRCSANIPVTSEEIAILRAFLSTEIDAIIYGDEPLPKG